MTMDRKQKTMLGVLSVLVLGMGGYWYATLGSDSGVSRIASRPPSVKIQRDSIVRNDKKPKTKRREPERSEASVQRHERKAIHRNPSPKRGRRTRRAEEKKKIPTPAS